MSFRQTCIAPPNLALQPTIEIGPSLATPSLGPIAIAAELCCQAAGTMRSLATFGLLLWSTLTPASEMFPVSIDPSESNAVWEAVLDYRDEKYGADREVELRGVDHYPVPLGGCASVENTERSAQTLKELLEAVRAPEKCGLVIEVGSRTRFESYRLEKVDGNWLVTRMWRSTTGSCRF